MTDTDTINDTTDLTDEAQTELVEGDEVEGEASDELDEADVEDEDEADEGAEGAVEGEVQDADGNALVEKPGKGKAKDTVKPAVKEDPEPALVTKAQAQKLTERLKKSLGTSIDLWVEVFEKRAWKAMGYPSFQEYLDDEFQDLRLRLPRNDRLAILPKLGKMNTRDAASVLGVDQKTVSNDRKFLAGTGEEAVEEKVVSRSGAEVDSTQDRPGRPIDWPKRATKAAGITKDGIEKLAESVNVLATTEALSEQFVEFREEWQSELGGLRAMLDAVLGQLTGE